jgi:hypothetical protein
MGKTLICLQVNVPIFYGPIYKGIFANIYFLFPTPNLPNMFVHTQVAR